MPSSSPPFRQGRSAPGSRQTAVSAGILLALTLFLLATTAQSAQIQVETASGAGSPWRGLTADAGNVLRLQLEIPEAEGPVFIATPSLGRLSTSGALPIASSPLRSILPDAHGRATVFFHPPAYLSFPADSGIATGAPFAVAASGPSRVATTTLRFTWKPRAGFTGQEPRLELPLAICRPPVLLIHGFTGSNASLASFAYELQKRRFDVIARDYFNRNATDRAGSSVEAQAERLTATIQETKAAWASAGYKLPRVDIVGHSLGGLIARQYLEVQPATAPVAIRKLIMVGTPNHGITWLERVAARLIAEFQAGRHQRAAEQLFSGSPLFKRLNAGEASGRHLRPDVQYALIIGLRSRYEYYDIAGNLFGDLGAPADDDGVVTRASAQLNGVQTYVSGQVYHTFTPHLQKVFSRDTALTRSEPIGDRLAKLLSGDIPRPALAGSELVIRRTQGQVFRRRAIDETWSFVGSWPTTLGSGWTAFRTEDGRALLGLSLKGSIWASIAIPERSELEIGYASPQLVQIRIVGGEARFTTMRSRTGRFEIVLGTSAGDWKEFQPRARVCNLDTDFTVAAGEEITVRSREGRVAIQGFASDGRRLTRMIGSGSALAIDRDGRPRAASPSMGVWWDDPFFDPSREDWGESTEPTPPVNPGFEGGEPLATTSLGLLQGHDEELQSLFWRIRDTLAEVASSGPILTESGWSSDERRQRVTQITAKAGEQARSWVSRNRDLPLPLLVGARYFARRIAVLIDPTFAFNGDPRREAFFFAEFARGRDDMLREFAAFVKPVVADPGNPVYLDRVLQGLGQTAHLLEEIHGTSPKPHERPDGPHTWQEAWRSMAQRVMSVSEEADLAARRFENEGSLFRLNYAAKYFKLRLKEIGRAAWEKKQSESEWQRTFERSTSELVETLGELKELLAAMSRR